MNYSTILALTPILALLDGYAMQSEQIKAIDWCDTHDKHGNPDGQHVSCIHFPCGEFRRVTGGWVLSGNSTPLAIFPA